MTHTNHFFWHCLLTSCPFLCGQILHDSTPDCKRPSAETPSLLLQNAAQNVGSAEFVVTAWWKLISHPGINYLVQQSSAYSKSTGLSQEEQAGLVLPKCSPKHPCPAEHQDGWCCCDHHCAVRCPFLSPALLTRLFYLPFPSACISQWLFLILHVCSQLLWRLTVSHSVLPVCSLTTQNTFVLLSSSPCQTRRNSQVWQWHCRAHSEWEEGSDLIFHH